MKNFKNYTLFFLISMAALACQNQETKDYISGIQKQRDEKNISYADSLNSPLNPKHLAEFTGLDYFKIDPDFRVEATFELTPEEKPFAMATSTDRAPIYRKYGNLYFKINDKKFILGAYQDMESIDDTVYNHSLFIPFQDLTSSKEAYGGGRYIEIEIPKSDQVVLDFNLAYNPYCAYDDRWSCVIPPPENFLETKILAGEKKFHLSQH